MLYLHCGWPKTGTTSLQSALVRHQDQLFDVGLVYPEQWRNLGGNDDPSHNGLLRMLGIYHPADPDFGEFTAFLEAHKERDILLSSEGLFALLLKAHRHRIFEDLLALAQDVMPVTCIWTLRQLDEVLRSLYLQRALRGQRQVDPTEYLATFVTTQIFPGIRKVEEFTGGRSVYVQYDEDGQHNTKVIDELGLPHELRASLLHDLEMTDRVNKSRSHKEMVAVIHADALSKRAGVPLDKGELLGVFDRGGITFSEDGPCVIGDRHVRRKIREEMLRSAQRYGVDSYVRFFGAEDASEVLPEVSLNADAISDGELCDLVEAVAAYSSVTPHSHP